MCDCRHGLRIMSSRQFNMGICGVFLEPPVHAHRETWTKTMLICHNYNMISDLTLHWIYVEIGSFMFFPPSNIQQQTPTDGGSRRSSTWWSFRQLSGNPHRRRFSKYLFCIGKNHQGIIQGDLGEMSSDVPMVRWCCKTRFAEAKLQMSRRTLQQKKLYLPR